VIISAPLFLGAELNREEDCDLQSGHLLQLTFRNSSLTCFEHMNGQLVFSSFRRSYQALDVDMRSRAVKPQHGNSRFQRRLSTYKELLYICDGDTHGVCYFAGTSYGAHPWMNPVTAQRLTVTSSSPPSRYTDGKLLVSRNYLVSRPLLTWLTLPALARPTAGFCSFKSLGLFADANSSPFLYTGHQKAV
jgi:hypothetical protein